MTGRSPRWMSWPRLLVVAMVLVWCLLASPVPTSLRGSGAVLVAFLVATGVVLGQNSQWRVWRRTSQLDERERQARDNAYRLAFRAMGIGIFVLVVTASIADALHGQTRGPLAFADGPRYLIAALLLFGLLPTVILTWPEARSPAESPSSTPSGRLSGISAAMRPALAGLLVLGVWGAALWLVPAGTVRAIVVPSPNLSMSGGTCGAVQISRQLGGGLGAALNISTNICWNGRHAWDGDRSLGPAGKYPFPPVEGNPPTCSLGIDSSDFEPISSESCTEEHYPSGELRIVAQARVSSGIDGWLSRTIRASIAITAKGKVLKGD